MQIHIVIKFDDRLIFTAEIPTPVTLTSLFEATKTTPNLPQWKCITKLPTTTTTTTLNNTHPD